MARIRTIKPEFWQDENLGSISALAQLLAIGLLNICDDEGYFKAHPMYIKGSIFPYRDKINIKNLVDELVNIDYILIGVGSDQKSYGIVVNFIRHQKINRPTYSKIKEKIKFNEGSWRAHGGLIEGSPPEQGKEQGKERNRDSCEIANALSRDGVFNNYTIAIDKEVVQIFNYWKTKTNHANAKLDDKRKLKIRTALTKLGFTVDECIAAIDGCSNSTFHQGDNKRGRKYDGIEIIFKNAEKIEEFRDMQNMPHKKNENDPSYGAL